jgi:predicted Zn-dependent protease with MMP-like domain
MDQTRFEQIAAEEFAHTFPKYARHLKNIALLIEEAGDGTLLGLYHGVPETERGSEYGNLGTLPDTITLFYRPLLAEAQDFIQQKRAVSLEEAVRLAIRETLWHEIGHRFGMDEDAVDHRERAGTNRFGV